MTLPHPLPTDPPLQLRACWLWPDYPGGDLINAWAQFRKVFDLPEAPAAACPVKVTADQAYRLFVNGQWVADGPCRGFVEEWFYDAIDIAPFLKPGRNVIAALAHNPGIGTHQYIHAGYAGFLLEGETCGVRLDTDASWARRVAPENLRHGERLSIQLGWQEIVDAALGDGDWTGADYDDSHWPPCSFFGARPAGSPPWHRPRERDVPLLRTEILTPRRLVGTGDKALTREFERDRNIARAFREDSEGGSCRPAEGDLEDISIPAQAGNDVRFFVFDLGREFFATTLLEIEGATGGETIDCVVAEGTEDGRPVIREAVGCNMALAHRYVCREGAQTFESFWPLGGRYLGVAVRGGVENLRLRVRLRHREYPFEMKGCLEAPDTRFAEIFGLCRHTQQLCASDVYTDCPSREQAMWWGDIEVHFANSTLLAADDRLLTRGLRLMAGQRLPNGLTYGLCPTKSHECVLPDFSLAYIRTLWSHYQFSGTPLLAERYWAEIMETFGYFFGQSEGDGLLYQDKRYWLHLDWSELFKDGAPTLYNLQYLTTLKNGAELARLLGRAAEAAELEQRAEALAGRIRDRLWDHEKDEPLEGVDYAGKPVPRQGLHNLIYCLYCGFRPDRHQAWTRQDLLPYLAGPRPRPIELYENASSQADPHAPTAYYLHYAFAALDRLGHRAEVLDCIHRWWGDMLDRGLVTTEETWDAKPGVASLCHAWSAHPVQFLTRILLGIRQTAPGWSSIRFEPTFAAPAAKGAVDTPLGPVSVEWSKRENASTTGSLRLPPGMTASVSLPGQPAQTATHTFTW
ncbi:MAG: alpha-L-rhamnosidase C-terminal domain-containing protein [Verrucomicrobiota bacterium]